MLFKISFGFTNPDDSKYFWCAQSSYIRPHKLNNGLSRFCSEFLRKLCGILCRLLLLRKNVSAIQCGFTHSSTYFLTVHVYYSNSMLKMFAFARLFFSVMIYFRPCFQLFINLIIYLCTVLMLWTWMLICVSPFISRGRELKGWCLMCFKKRKHPIPPINPNRTLICWINARRVLTAPSRSSKFFTDFASSFETSFFS